MHRTLKVGLPLLLWMLSGLAGPGTVESADLPRVRLIATGGTIANRAGNRLTATDLIRSVPTLDHYVQAEAEQFANVPSNSLTLAHWMGLSRRINELFEQPTDLAGIVVTSGTDTLEETAYFLHLTVKSDRPVVVVGSMRSPGTLGYDGAANLLEAFRVAAEPASRGRGVLVVLDGAINSAREVTKTNAQRLQTFETRGYGVLGVANSDRVVYYRRLDRRHTFTTEFDVFAMETLPRVDILMAYQDAPGDLIRSASQAGARGMVMASAGAGSVSDSQRDAVRDALSRGVFVVFSTRTGSGRVAPRAFGTQTIRQPTEEEDVQRSAYRISGEDLAPLKARILLMLALTKTTDGEDIRRMFREY